MCLYKGFIDEYKIAVPNVTAANPDVMDNDVVWRKDDTVIAPTSNNVDENEKSGCFTRLNLTHYSSGTKYM